MKTIKSLVLGSAAGLLAVGGAQAADLPVKAKAVEYVRICSLYGAGFFYIPGTDTCIKLGGYLRADLTINGGVYDGPFYNGEGAIRDRYANFYADRSRLALTIDTRTATEYGVVRTFGQADFQFSTFGATNSIGNAASVIPSAWQGQLNNDTAGNGYVAVEMAFLQFAGFTFGKSASAYASQIVNAVGGIAGGSIGFNGASTSLITGLGSAYGGTSVPDFVGNVRVDQAWGLFQISGAIHDDHAAYFSNANIINGIINLAGAGQAGAVNFGHPDDKYGGAVMAALQIKNIPTGTGDDIKMSGSWSLGASKYVLGTSGADPSAFQIYSGTKFAMGVVTDSIYSGASAINPLTQQQLTRGWGFNGAFNHNWDPYWSTSLFGGIAGLSYNATAKTAWCNSYLLGGTSGLNLAATVAAGLPGVTTCDPGFTISEIGLVTRWTPVKNLTFSAEVLYAYLKTNMAGTVIATPSSALPLATTAYTYGSNGTASLNLRVQRNF
jgi:hypothetical protein